MPVLSPLSPLCLAPFWLESFTSFYKFMSSSCWLLFLAAFLFFYSLFFLGFWLISSMQILRPHPRQNLGLALLAFGLCVCLGVGKSFAN